MPSTPLDSGWDFSSAIDLIDSDVQDISSPKLTPKPRPLASVLQEEGGIRLGSFAKLFENLGLANDAPALPPLDSESELSTSDDVTLPSPILKAVQPPAKPVETEDQLAATALSKKQRQKARRKAEKEQQEELLKTESFQRELQVLVNAVQAERKSTEAASPSKPPRASRSNVSAKVRAASPPLLPKAVVPVAAPTSPQKPKTPKPLRPTILKRPSIAQPVTPQAVRPVEDAPVVQSTPTPMPFSTFVASAPKQYPNHNQLQLHYAQATTPLRQHGLVPRTVRPVTLPRNSQRAVVQLPSTPTPVGLPAPVQATPMGPPAKLILRSQVDRHFHLFQNLLNRFPDDQKWLVSPMQLVNEKTVPHGLHVFVDASNIMIGFKDMLRYHGIQPYEYDMSFDSLALLMERRRPVAKRIFAGSQREANPLPHVTKLVETSKAVGYDSVMQEQVLIVREDSEKKKFFNDVKKHGWHRATQLRSGSGSDSETGPPPAPRTLPPPKWVEQGVDEILHLKMCQSIIDTEVPSTMVLATGDGAEAEMSDGFLAHVERALKKGWKVELISWRQQTNGGYKNRKFRAKWAEQFQIIELDDFLEDVIDTP
ncbi:hypothetical protein J1614_011494 [Plenodomus biglobosus]|nr:hypothetical protein J1614_011494 [Plenodomus biglobosus]